MSEFDQSRAFLDEVLANPDDDAPRLIYADYLEELGDPRGEFIRTQCELATLDELDPRYFDLEHRCDELLFDHREAWAGELKQDVRKAEFSRGFIDKITMRARAFIKEADALYQSTPVNWLRFNYVKGAGEALAATAALSRIRSLDLSNLSIPDSDLIALLSSPRLANLEALDLSHHDAGFGAAVGRALAEMPSAGSLRHLALPAGEEFHRAVAAGSGFPSLEGFTVGASYSEESFRGIANLQLPNLRSLKVRGTLTVADAEAFASLPLENLESLDLESTRTPQRGFLAFAARGAFNRTVELNLKGAGVGIRSIPILLRDDQLLGCRRLNLSHNPNLVSSADGYVEQLAHKPFTRLRHLHLSRLRSADIRVLASAESLHQLELLELESCRLEQHDLATIASSPLGRSLRCLRLIGCEIHPDAVKRLNQARPLENLLRLEFGGMYDGVTSIEEGAVIEFASSPAFAGIQSLKLDFLFLSAAGLARIASKARLPELRQLSYCHNRASRKAVDAVMTSSGLPKLAKLVVTGSSGLRNRDKLIAEYGARIQF